MKTKRKNKGFTLLEIMIVISISAVLVGMVAVSASMIKRANVAKATQKLQKKVQQARSLSMAKGEAAGKLKIQITGGNVYAQVGADGDRELICGGSVKVICEKSHEHKGLKNMSGSSAGMEVEYNTAGMLKLDTDGARIYIADKDFTRQSEILIYTLTGKSEAHDL